MENELKKCPFCGGSAVFQFSDFLKVWWVKCIFCGCTTAPQHHKENAIEVWNIRKIDNSGDING